ncbi:hypothetical protein GZ77_11685 [Endozoicomonas montiporae]|uniref:POTRA domain-containing protein n=2 Tax=Endozoicomonas montiporae TaxID=1027273 RepID=A0A081N8Y8_9GAMM|nr:ShlB/FhaC/HecB family hemolysin secretion/activation protein [Endozoicomonas montiporae]AMO55164.1 hemolysin activation/secretion protein [Endozoicomonas montiporae CL-33]KEQ14911.1 hypothetical protein GZ77_11685 [Endozoicomonas montiporae]
MYNNKNNLKKSLRYRLLPSSQHKALVITVIVGASSYSLAAQPPLPDPAGVIGREIETQQRRLTDSIPDKKVPAVKKDTESPESDTSQISSYSVVVLQGVRFNASRHLSQGELEGVVKPWLAKPVSYQDLQTILNGIKQLYRNKGIYTATAVFPEQSIEDGVVSVRLVEGRFGELVLAGDPVAEYDADYFQHWINTDWQEKSIDVTALERDIQFYNRVHDQRLQAELKAGQSFGLTDVVIRVPESEQGLTMYFDNYGSKDAGAEQFSLLYQRESVFDPADKLLAYGVVSNGLRSLSGSYFRIVGYDGWRLGATFQYTDMSLQSYDVNVVGDSLRLSLDARYLVWFNDDQWLNLLLSGSRLESENSIAGEPLSDYRNDRFQFGVEYNYVGHDWRINARLLNSRVNSVSKINNDNRYINLSSPELSVVYNFNKPFYVMSSLQGQWSGDKNLPASLGFTLGGIYSIRGYRSNAVSGDNGWKNQTELHYYGFSLKQSPVDSFIFFDYGEIYAPDRKEQITSTGIGLKFAMPMGSMEITAAQRLNAISSSERGGEVYARFILKFN